MSKPTAILALALILGIISSASYVATLDTFYLVTMTLAVIGGACGIMIGDNKTELKNK